MVRTAIPHSDLYFLQIKVDINVVDTCQSKLVSQMSFIFPQESIESKEPKESHEKIKNGSKINSKNSISKKSTRKFESYSHPFKEDINMLTVSIHIQ